MKTTEAVRLLLSTEAGLDASLSAFREALCVLAGADSNELRAEAEASSDTYELMQRLLVELRCRRGRIASAAASVS